MSARDPSVRRALVTRLSEDGETAWVLVEWMKAMRQKSANDRGALSAKTDEKRGVEALSISGIEVGDEVLVDLRPLPVMWLSFLFFVLPIMLFATAAVLIYMAGEGAGLHPALTLSGQVLMGGAGVYGGFRYANTSQQAMEAAGLGTPIITAIMPRFVGEDGPPGERKKDLLQAVFFLTGPVSPQDWEFASAEFERISGVREARMADGRIEVVFQSGVIKEKHILELLTMFNFPVEVGHDPDA